MLEGCVPWPDDLVERYVRDGIWEPQSLGKVLEERARGTPQRVFLADEYGKLTYREVNRLASRIARELLRRGLRRRDIALMQLPNIREFVIVFFALQKIGVVPVMCLPAHREREIGHFAQMTGARAMFFSQGDRGFDSAAMAKAVQTRATGLRHLFAVGGGEEAGIGHLGPVFSRAFDEADDDEALEEVPVDPFEVAFMLLSGGTTGVPKLIPRTHADYLYNCRQCAEVLGWDSGTVYAAALPAAHNFALGAPGIIAVLAVGGTVVLSSSTEADDVLGAIEKHQATVLPVTPALMIALLESEAIGRRKLSSLRQVCVGGQRMLPELFERIAAALGHVIPIHAFGMAEGLTNLTRPGDARELKRQTQGRPVSPLDQIRIVDEMGRDVAEGAVGELITRGPYTIRGYYRAAAHNAEAFTADGYYRTGDLVRLHPSGNLIVEGRKKDVINRGGEKISVEEVEDLILSHPGVRMVAVVAMPCPVMGERSCAFVVPVRGQLLTLNDLTLFLTEKKIAKFKLPERLEVVDALPLTTMGKVAKKVLREQVATEMAGAG